MSNNDFSIQCSSTVSKFSPTRILHYSAKFWWGKTWVKHMSFNHHCFLPSQIPDSPKWLCVKCLIYCKLTKNFPRQNSRNKRFTTKVLPCQNFALYSTHTYIMIIITDTVEVLHDYNAEQLDELTLRTGDIIRICRRLRGGWSKGEINGRRGIFHEFFVKKELIVS